MENMERLKKEKFDKKKSNQNDLVYQINEKEKMRHKENHDKVLEERTAKLLEAEYLRKIEEYKQHQNRKVIIFCQIFKIIFYRLRKLEIRNISIIFN